MDLTCYKSRLYVGLSVVEQVVVGTRLEAVLPPFASLINSLLNRLYPSMSPAASFLSALSAMPLQSAPSMTSLCTCITEGLMSHRCRSQDS